MLGKRWVGLRSSQSRKKLFIKWMKEQLLPRLFSMMLPWKMWNLYLLSLARKEFDSERAKMAEEIGGECSNHKNNASSTTNYPKGLMIVFSLKRKSIGKPVKNGGRVEPVTNSGGVCKEDKNLDSNGHIVKEIQNVSEDISEGPQKENHKTVENCEQTVSQEIVYSKSSILKATKRNSKDIIAEESKAEDLQDAIFHDRDHSSERVCQENNEKVTSEERCSTFVHEEKDISCVRTERMLSKGSALLSVLTIMREQFLVTFIFKNQEL